MDIYGYTAIVHSRPRILQARSNMSSSWIHPLAGLIPLASTHFQIFTVFRFLEVCPRFFCVY
jgi:hypothetical protein